MKKTIIVCLLICVAFSLSAQSYTESFSEMARNEILTKENAVNTVEHSYWTDSTDKYVFFYKFLFYSNFPEQFPYHGYDISVNFAVKFCKVKSRKV